MAEVSRRMGLRISQACANISRRSCQWWWALRAVWAGHAATCLTGGPAGRTAARWMPLEASASQLQASGDSLLPDLLWGAPTPAPWELDPGLAEPAFSDTLIDFQPTRPGNAESGWLFDLCEWPATQPEITR